nr:hypothetical protein [Actinomycetota bacterium]
LFSESPSRVVLCVEADTAEQVRRRAQAAGVSSSELGVAGGERLVVRGLVDVGIDEAEAAWRNAIPAALAHA